MTPEQARAEARIDKTVQSYFTVERSICYTKKSLLANLGAEIRKEHHWCLPINLFNWNNPQ